MRYKLPFIFILVPIFLSAQETNKRSLSFQQDFHDYGVNLLDGKLFNFDSSLSQTFRIGYNHLAFRSVQFSVGLSNGFLWNDQVESTFTSKNYAVGIDATAMFLTNNGKIFRTNAPFSPYFSVGYQYYYIKNLKRLGLSPVDFSIQYGLGINLNFWKRSSLQVQSTINQQLGSNFNTHFIHRLGFTQVIDLSKDEGSKNNRPDSKPNDYDMDGLADIDDQCPTMAGLAINFGCPEGYLEERAGKIAKLDSMEGLLLSIKTRMEQLNEDIISLNKYKSETAGQPYAKEKDVTETPRENKADTPKEKDNDEEKTPDNTGDEIEIVKEKTNSYYIVTISAMNELFAVAEAKKIRAKYPNVKVISQPNGFFRTAIYSGTDKAEAVKLLERVTENGTKQAWIAFY